MTFTRRQLLAHLAGVPMASLVGCGSSSGFEFSGELLSPDHTLGHRLRDGWRPPAPVSAASEHRVVIVGGGIAGLSAAWRLMRLGIEDFVVLELEQRPGGTAIFGHRDGFQFPWGAHYVPAPMKENEALIELFREMEIVVGVSEDGEPEVAETDLCREPEERVFADGQWTAGLYPAVGASQDDLQQLERFRKLMREWAQQRDEMGRRMFAIPMSMGSDHATVQALDQMSMLQWMTSVGFTSSRLVWLVDYACRDDYGLTVRQASAWAGIFYFASRLRGDSEESQPVITWPEGNGRLVRYLADRCGERLRSGHAVTAIDSVAGDRIRVRAVSGDALQSQDFIAQDVIFAVPHFLAPHLIAGWPASGRSLQSFRYGGWVVANVFLRERPQETQGAMCWDNVICDSQSLGYVTSTHQTGRDHGATVLTWYHPLLDDDPRVSRAELMRLEWRDWATVVVADLCKPHPDIIALIDRVDIMRWGHAMIQPRVGFVWGQERQAASQSLGRIHFAGTDLSGIALMEEAFDRGVQAAGRCFETV